MCTLLFVTSGSPTHTYYINISIMRFNKILELKVLWTSFQRTKNKIKTRRGSRNVKLLIRYLFHYFLFCYYHQAKFWQNELTSNVDWVSTYTKWLCSTTPIDDFARVLRNSRAFQLPTLHCIAFDIWSLSRGANFTVTTMQIYHS